MRRWLESLQLRVDAAVARWDKSLRRFYVLDLLLDTLDSFNRDTMGVLAAALTYYALLALFPLLLFLILIASNFLSDADAIATVMHEAGKYLPGFENEIEAILSQVVAARGPATLITVLFLLWSASGVFDIMQIAVDRAWHVPVPRAFWLQRIYSVAVIAIVGLVFVTSVLVATLSSSFFFDSFGDSETARAGYRWLGRLVGILMSFAAFAIVYKTFPHANVPWRAAALGALAAALLWEVARYAFEFYLANIARFNLVYGSLGAIIGLLFWGYISAMILLFGSELSATFARRVAVKQATMVTAS